MSSRNGFLRGKGLTLLAVPWLALAAGLHADTAPAAAPAPAATSTPDPGPFNYTDFSWVLGNSRWTDNSMIDSKWFTPQFIVDVNYVDDFNHPIDHTISGSTSEGRSDEVQLQQLGVGGDLHVDDGGGNQIRGRIMTGFGMDSEMVPRNDETPSRGGWNLGGAYQIITEGYGGYHWDVLHGVNLDAGIFPSYVGLYNYYNTENWTYQASYVSSNTPWFFNGVRLQIFPTDQLKTEFWLINGWQTYGMFNDKLAAGYQIKWANLDGWFSSVYNGYVGFDSPDSPDLVRLHSDNSWLARDYKSADKDSFFTWNAWSLTADIGGQQGPVGSATAGSGDPGHTDVTFGPGPNEEAFFGAMLYNRTQFYHDKFAFTFGGGFVNNPGQYLLLVPPVTVQATGQPATAGTYGTAVGEYDNGANGSDPNPHAVQPIPNEAPGSAFIGENFQVAFDYMPSQYLLYRIEFAHDETDIPYYSGPGGVTSTDGWNPAAGTGSSTGGGWTPDLVKFENRIELCMELEI
jgi:hypothetical protein